MRLSRQCEIAIDVLVFCARKPQDIIRSNDVADFAKSTPLVVHQLVPKLVSSGVLASFRGRNGGIQLAREAKHILVGEVVRLMEPAFTKGDLQPYNSAFGLLAREARNAALDTFDAFTIADLEVEESHPPLACLTCDIRRRFGMPMRASGPTPRVGSVTHI